MKETGIRSGWAAFCSRWIGLHQAYMKAMLWRVSKARPGRVLAASFIQPLYLGKGRHGAFRARMGA